MPVTENFYKNPVFYVARREKACYNTVVSLYMGRVRPAGWAEEAVSVLTRTDCARDGKQALREPAPLKYPRETRRNVKMANRVVMKICGEEFTFLADESADYVQKVGAFVGKRMQETLNTAKVGRTQAAILTAVNIADELFKIRETDEQLRGQIKGYLEESTRAKAEISDLKRENLRLQKLQKKLEGDAPAKPKAPARTSKSKKAKAAEEAAPVEEAPVVEEPVAAEPVAAEEIAAPVEAPETAVEAVVAEVAAKAEEKKTKA